MDILFLFSPLIFTISRTFSLAGRSSGWAWPGCSITSLSGPCWMSAPVPSALTWRDKYIRYHRIPSLSNRHGVTRLYIPRSFESKDLIPMVVAISVGISINPGQCDIASHQPAQPSNIGSLSHLRRPRTKESPCWPSLTARPWPSSTPTSSSLTDREDGTSPASPARCSLH